MGIKRVLTEILKQGSGGIINISSVVGLVGSPNVSPHVNSKHAVAGITESAALEAVAQGVLINSVHPLPVNTRVMRALGKGFAPGVAETVKFSL